VQPAEAVTDPGRPGQETIRPETARPYAARPERTQQDPERTQQDIDSRDAGFSGSRASQPRPVGRAAMTGAGAAGAGTAGTARSPGSARAGGRAETRANSFRSHVTLRGAVIGMLLLSLVACLLAAWLSVGELAGLGFCAGCVLAPLYARRDAQLQIVAAAPVIFLAAVIITQALTAQGSSNHGRVESVLEGTLLSLATAAPWLFAGTAACVAVAWRQGLPDCVRELRSGLREARSGRREAPSGRGSSAFRPARRPPFAAPEAARKPFAQAPPRLPRRQ
jgi:hypothetical protein